jgi:predicted kinase
MRLWAEHPSVDDPLTHGDAQAALYGRGKIPRVRAPKGASMATLFLICGLPGAGKTTLARQIEQTQPALRLAPDEWIAAILADAADIEERDRLRSPIEAVQWEIAKRVLALGNDVVLEWGFWSRAERAWYRSQAEALGARVELRYLAVGRDELWARLAKRNAQLPPGTFAVTEDELDRWSGWFEPPTADELPDRQ